ncbi:thiazole biosynthesis/tRNA modification protein ThiI [Aciduliprofundum sp. MAR08-339]|uniref:tRNA uracil 4-sulfurtransferase ThiI n=1 Tax=Aciduliprofundum sp. (strain MAR08-339) TaxID=673860 RepID=UPI0002A49E0A|nr:thiazole biosynthesis/tRNA modification protein ThiI [Aciduliprofundum sp. MAR08-339]
MIIVRYGEIGLKGRNRKKFEELLAKNIERKLKRYGYSSHTKILRGRIFVFASDEAAGLIAKCPGVVSVSPAREVEEHLLFEHIKNVLSAYSPKSFRVSTHRVDKNYPKTSQEINEEIGRFIVEEFGWRVDLENPELTVGVEIIKGRFYVYLDRIPGIGGLPVGSAGKLVLLISPGIDSPVAGYLMMKRGSKIVALHLKHGDEGVRKVEKIVEVLDQYSPRKIELVVEDHSVILEKIAHKLKEINRERWICVFCKYTMLKIANDVAQRYGALGIITGDSLGQVASQTLENMYIESQATSYPIYRPLIGMDKNEIERIAREIGTYDVFLSMGEEKCLFRPRFVTVQGKYEEFEKIKNKLGI